MLGVSLWQSCVLGVGVGGKQVWESVSGAVDLSGVGFSYSLAQSAFGKKPQGHRELPGI